MLNVLVTLSVIKLYARINIFKKGHTYKFAFKKPIKEKYSPKQFNTKALEYNPPVIGWKMLVLGNNC